MKFLMIAYIAIFFTISQSFNQSVNSINQSSYLKKLEIDVPVNRELRDYFCAPACRLLQSNIKATAKGDSSRDHSFAKVDRASLIITTHSVSA